MVLAVVELLLVVCRSFVGAYKRRTEATSAFAFFCLVAVVVT